MIEYAFELQDGAMLTQSFTPEQVETGAADQDFLTGAFMPG